ncbi:hypothetical protein F7725_008895 [Dissostichus mawsoni]|uniref:Dynein light chain Tctex-type 3 n=1 Tax=Dissostichus mawsoni TaxID=36200 RepID=A0A7J5Z5Y6_DISMA|nr:hypothetical protein F7725_008895 [Dissostichus mawsoni]
MPPFNPLYMTTMEEYHSGSESSFHSEEADNIVKECIEGVVGNDDYSQSLVNKWTAGIVERCLTQLVKQGKPYKYIDELDVALGVRQTLFLQRLPQLGWAAQKHPHFSPEDTQSCDWIVLRLVVNAERLQQVSKPLEGLGLRTQPTSGWRRKESLRCRSHQHHHSYPNTSSLAVPNGPRPAAASCPRRRPRTEPPSSPHDADVGAEVVLLGGGGQGEGVPLQPGDGGALDEHVLPTSMWKPFLFICSQGLRGAVEANDPLTHVQDHRAQDPLPRLETDGNM